MVKTIHGGAVIRLWLVDDDGLSCCAEDEDGNIAAMVDEEAEQATLARLAAQVDRIANTVQGQPTREDYDALVAENVHLRDLVAALGARVEQLENGRRVAA